MTICADCGATISTEHKTVAPIGHNFTGAVKANENGTHSFKCVNGCGQYGGAVSCSGEWTVSREATIYSEGEKMMTCDVCEQDNIEMTEMLPSETAADPESGIYVSFGDGAFEEDEVAVFVEEIYDGTEFFMTKLNKQFNISIIADGEEVQPTEPVVVRIPIPEGFNANSVTVLHINSLTGAAKPVTVISRENGYISFIANSFSVYIRVDESSDIDQPQTECSHLCHKGGFLGFLWKIINFFNKIFKINQFCECGVAHW